MIYLQEIFINRLGGSLELFKKIDNSIYTCRCPICGDSKKSKSKTRFNFFIFENNYFVKCYNCSYSNSFDNFLREFDNLLFTEYKLQKIKEYNLLNKPNIIKPDIDLRTNIKFNDINNELDLLSGFNDINNSDKLFVDYINSRLIPKEYFSRIYSCNDINLLTSRIEKYKDKVYFKSPCILFPFYNKDKQISCVQIRYLDNSIKNRFLILSLLEDDYQIYNEDLIDSSSVVSITEGPIDSLFCFNCVAIAGLTNKNKINYLYSTYPNIRIVPDNDYKINHDVKKMIYFFLEMNYNIVLFDRHFKGLKDLNDAIKSKRFTYETLNEYLNTRTFSGLKAKLEFSKTLMEK